MKIGNVDFSSEMIAFMKDNRELIKTMLENNETREVEFNQNNLFSILNSFFETNESGLMTINNDTFDHYEESEILGVFNDKGIVILSVNDNKIYLIKVRNKLAVIGKELISTIPWLDC